MDKKFRNLIIAAAGVISIDYIAMRIMLSIAFEPESRFYRKNLLEESPYWEQYRRGIEWVHKRNGEIVEIRSFDGLKLKALYIKADEPKRTLMMFHGWRGSWQHDFAPLAEAMAKEGCSLLLIDQRAQGGSGGKYMSMGILERRDCLSWVKWMEQQEMSALPVYLYGMSMGAAAVLMASGDKLYPCIKGIIADCGFTDSYDMLLRTGKAKLKLVGGVTMKHLRALCKKRCGFDFAEYTARDAMGRCKVPVLFIHGRADDFVPYEMTVDNYEACRSEKRLLLVDGAGHCMSYLTAPEKYMEAVREFFLLAEV